MKNYWLQQRIAKESKLVEDNVVEIHGDMSKRELLNMITNIRREQIKKALQKKINQTQKSVNSNEESSNEIPQAVFNKDVISKLESAIDAYRLHGEPAGLKKLFRLFAESIVLHKGYSFQSNYGEAIEETVRMAMNKATDFGGSAKYFIMIMYSHLKAVFQAQSKKPVWS